MAGGGNDTKGATGVQGDWASVGDVEGCGGDLTSPAHNLHHLPRIPTRISGGSRHKYRHPRGQVVTTACVHEGGGPVRDLPVGNVDKIGRASLHRATHCHPPSSMW